MSKDKLNHRESEMMQEMLDMVLRGDDVQENDAPLLSPAPQEDYFNSDERLELYRQACEYAKEHQYISEGILENKFVMSYCTIIHIIKRMQQEGLISKKQDDDYRYHTL